MNDTATGSHTDADQAAAMPSVEQKAARPRIEFVDVAKGIAMLSIVAGHVGFVNPTAMDVLSRIVFPYHVPVLAPGDFSHK